MDNLPHLVVEEPKRNKKQLAAIIIFSLMIVLIPVGIYLVSQRTQLLPQAASPDKTNTLETSLTLSSDSKQAALGGESAVDIYLKADSDNINLVKTKIKFDPQLLKVVRIATSSSVPHEYFAGKWIEASFDNSKGEISLIGGLSDPGVKTDTGQTLKFATIFLKPQRLGPASLSFMDGSEVFRNSDNLNALQKTTNLEINVSEGLAQSLGPLQEVNPSSQSASLKLPGNLNLISPNGGEAFSFFKPLTILWNSKDIDKITSISILVNNQPFGVIASNIINTNRYFWLPETTLLLAYITPSNTYQIEVTGVNKKGEQSKEVSSGPFTLLAKEDVKFSTPSADLTSTLEIKDASLILSQFNKELPQSKVDLNQDGIVNQVDLWLLTKYLIAKGVIS